MWLMDGTTLTSGAGFDVIIATPTIF